MSFDLDYLFNDLASNPTLPFITYVYGIKTGHILGTTNETYTRLYRR